MKGCVRNKSRRVRCGDSGNIFCVMVFHIYFTILHLLTPWSKVFPEKLTGSQLVKKLPAFYGTRTFITAVISARHLSLS
jgi:hypothetical protein